MRAPIRMTGVPRPRPVATPVHMGGDPMQMIPILEEMRRLVRFIESWGPRIIEAGHKLESIKEGKPGAPGRSVALADVVAELKQQLPLPELHEMMLDKVARKAARHIPTPKRGKRGEPGTSATAPATTAIVEELFRMLTTGEAQLGLEHVQGLAALIENKVAEVRNLNAGTVSGQDTSIRGGGDTVEAGNNVTITNTVNGRKKINATGGVGPWLTPVEAPNGVRVTFTVTMEPTDVVADGVQYFAGAGYSYAALQITLDNPPAQYVRYR